LFIDVTFEPLGWPSAARIGLPSIVLVFAAAAQDLYRKPAGESLLTRLGDASYSAYLLHPIVIVAMVMVFDNVLGNNLSSDIAILVATPILTAVISLLSLRVFEKPTAKAVRDIARKAGLRPPSSESRGAGVLTTPHIP
jgi:peptidoglycan/LPS O-acetylase OafA/YrhL